MEQPQVLYTPPPQPIVIVQGEGGGQKSTNWFALIIGFLILVIIIMAIVWALAYQRNASGDTTDEGSGTGSDLECPKKISATASTTCKWLRKNSMNTRCLAEGKGECTEEIAKKECAILGKWSALDEGKFVCIFNSNKEMTEFGSSSSDEEQPKPVEEEKGTIITSCKGWVCSTAQADSKVRCRSDDYPGKTYKCKNTSGPGCVASASQACWHDVTGTREEYRKIPY